MANLNTSQINELWDNRFQSEKKFVGTQYDSYKFASKLDGYNYYLNYPSSDQIITDSCDVEAVENQVKSDLQNVEYKGIKPIINDEKL